MGYHQAVRGAFNYFVAAVGNLIPALFSGDFNRYNFIGIAVNYEGGHIKFLKVVSKIG